MCSCYLLYHSPSSCSPTSCTTVPSSFTIACPSLNLILDPSPISIIVPSIPALSPVLTTILRPCCFSCPNHSLLSLLLLPSNHYLSSLLFIYRNHCLLSLLLLPSQPMPLPSSPYSNPTTASLPCSFSQFFLSTAPYSYSVPRSPPPHFSPTPSLLPSLLILLFHPPLPLPFSPVSATGPLIPTSFPYYISAPYPCSFCYLATVLPSQSLSVVNVSVPFPSAALSSTSACNPYSSFFSLRSPNSLPYLPFM
jgi:hypothetical protein